MSAPTRSTDATLDGTIALYSGGRFKPLDPDPALITIEDIAHALSNVCRFTGHVREFYSVAQHSVHASWVVPPELALCALLHDASEAYLSDFARPIKQAPGFGEIYREVEERLMEAVAVRFGIPWPMPDLVKWADNVLLRTEQRDLMPPTFRHEGEDYLDFEIESWLPKLAELRFLDRYEEVKCGRSRRRIPARLPRGYTSRPRAEITRRLR